MQIIKYPKAFQLSLAFAGVVLMSCGFASAQTKSLYIKHKHTGEEERIVFKEGGSYSSAGLKKLNWMLRDWRKDEPTEMDPALFDVLHEVYRQTGTSEAIHVVSAFRSSGTNAMLRRRSRAVAKNSQHIQGKAMDFYIPGVSTMKIREVALKLEQGGVGFYPRAGTAFIHVDTGSVRHWPKMSRDQLANVFPDGKTVHIPRDGKPMSGFDYALANLQKKGGTFSRTLAYSNRGENEGEEKGDGGRLFAALFGGKPTPPVITNMRPKIEVAAKPEVIAKPEVLEEKDEAPLVKPAALEKAIVEKSVAEKPVVTKPKFMIASAPLPIFAPREREMVRTNLITTASVNKQQNMPIPKMREDMSELALKQTPLKVAIAPSMQRSPLPQQDPRGGLSSWKVETAAKIEPPTKIEVAAKKEPVAAPKIEISQIKTRKDTILSEAEVIVPQSFAKPLNAPPTSSFGGSSVVRVPTMSFR